MYFFQMKIDNIYVLISNKLKYNKIIFKIPQLLFSLSQLTNILGDIVCMLRLKYVSGNSIV